MPQITITFDCSDQSFQFNPSTQQIPYNSNSTIVWKVVAIRVPSNGTVKFPGTGGIVFAAGWPGSQPQIDPNDPTRYTATDDNNSQSTVGDWKYTTTLSYFNGVSQTTPSFDPDVENEGPPPIVTRKK